MTNKRTFACQVLRWENGCLRRLYCFARSACWEIGRFRRICGANTRARFCVLGLFLILCCFCRIWNLACFDSVWFCRVAHFWGNLFSRWKNSWRKLENSWDFGSFLKPYKFSWWDHLSGEWGYFVVFEMFWEYFLGQSNRVEDPETFPIGCPLDDVCVVGVLFNWRSGFRRWIGWTLGRRSLGRRRSGFDCGYSFRIA